MAKYRLGFVTNSSSSSFLIGFRNKDEMNKFRSTFPFYLKEEIIDQVAADVERSIISREAAIEIYEDEICEYDLGFRGKTWLDITWEEIQSDEFKMFVAEKKEEMAAEFRKEIEEYEFFAEVEYGDHDSVGSLLEHDIMPDLPNTICRFSHH